MSEPTKSFLGLIKDRKVRHGGNPVMRWMADNLELRRDTNDNVMPRKGDGTQKNRIDGMVAAIMALGRVQVHEDDTSVYESRGLEVLG